MLGILLSSTDSNAEEDSPLLFVARRVRSRRIPEKLGLSELTIPRIRTRFSLPG